MKISLARGDVIGAMIPHVEDTAASDRFRVDVLGLLLHLYQRAQDERVLDVVRLALKDTAGHETDGSKRRSRLYG
jgi:hypothetical protein